jgi:ADP-ribose pyrophosphatase YjhB (NUDIX family)
MGRLDRGGEAGLKAWMLWRRRIEPFLRPLFRAWFRTTRGLTLGVRALVTDAEGRILLVEHTYIHGWHLPGGGVERGETAEDALTRELVEEAGVALTGRARLVSIHNNDRHHPGDHVLLYRCEHWTPCPATARGEIHRVGWFEVCALPETTTAATRARIREALADEVSHPLW